MFWGQKRGKLFISLKTCGNAPSSINTHGQTDILLLLYNNFNDHPIILTLCVYNNVMLCTKQDHSCSQENRIDKQVKT